MPTPATIIDKLEEAGFFCRKYDPDNAELLAQAVATIWRHMCDLDSGYLPSWRDSTVGDLVDAGLGWGGSRNFAKEKELLLRLGLGPEGQCPNCGEIGCSCHEVDFRGE